MAMSDNIDVNRQMIKTIPLNRVTSRDLDIAGGKGSNLGELIQANFQVPPGFVISTDVYSVFRTENHLDLLIREQLRSANQNGEAIRNAFECAHIPEYIERTILDAYHELGEGAVAVRSSATAEDLPQAAFAGQQDTYLNVIGQQPLLSAVRRCWSSLWSDRAIAYRARQGIDPENVKIAVVVQVMVAAEAAGVMFTVNPVSGDRDEIVVNANPGLGEAVVSGLVTPDHFVVQNQHGRLEISERLPGRHEVIIKAQPHGGTYQEKGAISEGSISLPDEILIKLAHTGLEIQRHFKQPQDIEWAFAQNKLFILQARPITALPESLPATSRPVRMLSAMFSEMFPIRPYPLDQTTWLRAISMAAVEPIFSLIGISAPPLSDMFLEEDGVIVRFSGKVNAHPTPSLLLAPARLLLLSLRYDPRKLESDPLLIQAQKAIPRLEALDLQTLSWPGLLHQVDEVLDLVMPLAGEIRRRYYPRSALAFAQLIIILSLMGKRKLMGKLTSPPDSATTELNSNLENLASMVRSEPQLAEQFLNNPADKLFHVLAERPEGIKFLAAFHTFLADYGHREFVLSSVLQPTWKDDPALVLGMVQGMVKAPSQPSRGEPAWEAARDQLLQHPLMRIPPMRRYVFHLVAEARPLWKTREDTHFEATRILPVLRRLFLEIGRRLVNFGVLTAPEDVFHLKFADLKLIQEPFPPGSKIVEELHNLVQRRKEKRQSLEKIPLIDPRLYQSESLDSQAILTGTSGSPGVAEGPVRIIHSASEFGHLQQGDILVAPYTNPAWTPLFQRAAAVVADGGAAGSHAAIVAREYGVPAVMGTVDGTRKLVNGQRVRVDGNRGLVFALDVDIKEK